MMKTGLSSLEFRYLGTLYHYIVLSTVETTSTKVV